MEFFKINYSKLENLPQLKFYKLIIFILSLFVILIILACNIEIYEKSKCYGIYSNNILTININNKLSDKLKSSKYIIFNNKKMNFKINSYGNYEIIDNEIYQEIELVVDNNFYDNEVGLVEFYYDKKSVFKFVLDLFN